MSPAKGLQRMNLKLKKEWRLAFLSAVVIGLLTHMPALLSDIPNHDGLGSMYFNQNMVTSGRFFLSIACGFSSYYTVPWMIGLLGLAFLGCAAAVICEILEVKAPWAIVLSSGLLAVFPALASTFAYVFTLDGYMLALLLATFAVLLTKKYTWGFVPGALCLALSMGTYQAYLPFAMILSVFAVLMLWTSAEEKKFKTTLRYLYMGMGGAALYYIILQICLKVQGKELDTYQGISGLGAGATEGQNILATIAQMYKDFVAFTINGKVLWQNLFAAAALLLLAVSVIAAAVMKGAEKKWWKSAFLPILLVAIVLLPLMTNVILLISPTVTYHLLMRYQWVLYLIGAVAFLSKCELESKMSKAFPAVGFVAAVVLLFSYVVTDNIAYGNLQKKYEKTYSYCLRLLDRIEQTEGYYQGIPIAMIGVVGDEQYPSTDLTFEVTSNMIGMSGDMLLYTGENYKVFMANYLGATLNILPAEAMSERYYSEEYMAMDTFPGANSIQIIDGVMYIKTENTAR